MKTLAVLLLAIPTVLAAEGLDPLAVLDARQRAYEAGDLDAAIRSRRCATV